MSIRRSPFGFLVLVATALQFSALTVAARDPTAPPPRPAQLGLCMACHGTDGAARVPRTPHIGGVAAELLETALKDYRSGARRGPPMNGIANALQPRDIYELARWYAAQPALPKGGR